jgi:hypothetical protein
MEPGDFQSGWWYYPAMPTRNHEHGLEMVNLRSEIEQVCGTAHDRFCDQNALQA